MKLKEPANKKLTDMIYWDMSDKSYENIRKLTIGEIKDIQLINSGQKSYSLKITVTPNFTEKWQVVRVLGDKETDTQALAFKKGEEIVIAYRGSQELTDWVETDANYLVLNSHQPPSKTRAQLELARTTNIKGTLGVPNRDELNLEKQEQKKLKNAFDVATQFAEDVKNDFPNAKIDTTGHSLGGALATYVRVMATYRGKGFVRQTTTFAAPNVYGMFTDEVKEQIDQGVFRNNTIDYTDPRDTFGTWNDRYPQVGVQHLVNNESFWLGNHKSVNFSHLFLSDGEIQLTPKTIKELAEKGEVLHGRIKDSLRLIDMFEEIHDDTIRSIQYYFEGQIGYRYDKLQVSDVKSIINRLAVSTSGGTPKFYDPEARKALLEALHELQQDALDIKENLQKMAHDFENKDKELANWLSIQ